MTAVYHPRERLVVSIGDYSGAWSAPWRAAGYVTLRVDPKLTNGDQLEELDAPIGCTAQEFVCQGARLLRRGDRVDGILMAPPCTDFSVSGAQYWPAKDADGRTEAALDIVDACLGLVDTLRPRWWMLENPVGRLPRLRPGLGKPRCYVQPHEFAHLSDDPEAERYTKRTGLWGSFNVEALLAQRGELTPIRVCKQGSWLQRLGGKSERTKTLRSMTPSGLARATFNATQET